MAKGKSSTQWIRVSGHDLDPNKFDREKENKNIMNKEIFKEACETVGIEPTKRQASKFKRKKGLVYKLGRK